MAASFVASIFTAVLLLGLSRFQSFHPDITPNLSQDGNYDDDAKAIAKAFTDCVGAQGTNEEMVHSRYSYFYHIYIKQWNQRVNETYPYAYFVPRTTSDVQAAVKCAQKLHIRLFARSGGHSYEPVSFGTNTSIVVDFRKMENITIQESTPDGPIATLQPGAMLGHVVAYLWRNGGYMFPMGNCFTVNIGGHAIGGGIGFWGTTYGLTLDNVVEFTMVTANGEKVKANKDTNPELFWALRGVGPGGLGIVTELKIKLFKAKDVKLTFISASYPVQEFDSVFNAYQNFLSWAQESEPSAFLSMTVSADQNSCPPASPGEQGPGIPCTGMKGIQVEGLHIYDPTRQKNGNASFITEFYKTFPSSGNITTLLPDFLQFVYATGSNPADKNKAGPWPPELANNLKNMIEKESEVTDEWILNYLSSVDRDKAVPRFFKSKSFLVDKFLKEDEISRVSEAMQDIPQDANWVLFLPEGGAMSRVPFNQTSYSHRHSLYDITVYTEAMYFPRLEEDGLKWQYKFWDTIEPIMDSGATYQNFPDEDYGRDEYPRRFWGENLQALINLKRKWDPRDFFHNRFSIPLQKP